MDRFSRIKAYFTNKEILQRTFYTLFLLLIFRILSKVPAPGIDPTALQDLFGGPQQASGLFNMANILAGGTLTQFSIISVGLFAFINASVILQLLGSIVPKIDQLQKMGEVGRKIINQWTRLLTVPLAALQSFGIYLLLKSNLNPLGRPIIDPLSPFKLASLILVLTAGSMLLVWLSELISEKGLGGKQGGGTSVIVTAGILASLPVGVTKAFSGVTNSNFLKNLWIAFGVEVLIFIALAIIVVAFIYLAKNIYRVQNKVVRFSSGLMYAVLLLALPAFLIYIVKVDNTFTNNIDSVWRTYTSKLFLVDYRFGFYLGLTIELIGLITFFNESYRAIPIRFVSRIRGLANPNDEKSFLPVKLLAPGVMPIIFASSLLLLPQVLYKFFGSQLANNFHRLGQMLEYAANGWLDQTHSVYYYILHFMLIVLFSMFFVSIIMKPEDIATNLKSQKTFIPGVRPGKETVDYISSVVYKISFWGGLILALVSSMPFILGIYNTQVSAGIENFIAGGTSIFIVVPTILAVKTQLDALVLTKNYEKFEEI